MRKTKISVLSVAALSAALVFDALACTVAIVGKKASTTGCVIVGHNEDNAMVRVRHGLVPARDWPVGAVLPAEPGMAAIPQVPRTLGFFWSQMKSAEGHVPAGDSFLNEKGVLVVSDNAGPTKVDPADGSRLTDGGMFYNLRRAVAERATSARDAVRVVGELVERWGYAPPGRIYTVADADEGWMVQVVGCRQWVARRCPDDAIAVCPNHYTIHSIPPEPTDDCLYSSNLVAHAVAKGWWPPDRPFDFAAAYQATNWWKIAHNTGRQTLLTSLLLGRAWRDESYPFCVKAARKVSPEDVKAALCAHGDGGGKPHVDDFDRPALCRAQTVESLVCAYAKPLAGTVLHVSGHHPCTSGYRAVKPLSGEPLPAAFDDGDAAARLDAHLAK